MCSDDGKKMYYNIIHKGVLHELIEAKDHDTTTWKSNRDRFNTLCKQNDNFCAKYSMQITNEEAQMLTNRVKNPGNQRVKMTERYDAESARLPSTGSENAAVLPPLNLPPLVGPPTGLSDVAEQVPLAAVHASAVDDPSVQQRSSSSARTRVPVVSTSKGETAGFCYHVV